MPNMNTLELDMWLTREKLAEAQLELWQYKRAQAQAQVLKLAQEIQESEGSDNGTQSS